MKKLIVLMSAYNGEKYLPEQLDSILNQDCERFGKASFSLLVRDDGSQDGTREILEQYALQYPDRISWYPGENVGVINSFWDLLERAGENEYYAFSDQDDYWMPGKLTRAVEKLEELEQQETERGEGGRTGKPLLYCCRPRLVDGELRSLESEIIHPAIRPAFENALIENISTGCTQVFNQELRNRIIGHLPEFTIMHDWWLYLIATCFGQIYYDEESFLCYRQHGNNVVGVQTSQIGEFKMRARRFRSNRGNISHQAGELVRIFEKEVGENPRLQLARQLVEAKGSFRARRRLLRKGGLYRQRKMDNRIFYWILLSGAY